MIKNFVINILFEDLNIPKIQIILHVKKTINEHIAFIDLPITHFTLGFNSLYKTKLAQFALDTKINLIDSITNKIVYNRIIKYKNRGFYFAKTTLYGYITSDDQRIIKLYDSTNYVNITYTVDCTLADIKRMVYFMENNIEIPSLPTDTNITKIEHNINYEYNIQKKIDSTIYNFGIKTKMLKYMYYLGLNTTNTLIVKKNRVFNEYIDSIEYMHNHVTYLYTIKYINLEYKYKNIYKYKDNERSKLKHSYSVYDYKKNKFKTFIIRSPFFTILTLQEFLQINLLNPFYTEYITYFLNNHGSKCISDKKYTTIFSKLPEHIISKI